MPAKTVRPPPTAASMPLAVGAVWRGHQSSGLKSYEVEVRIAGVDDSTGDVCGTLTIKHLLPTLPKVVTFFDGEIIGPQHHDFVTDKWGASEEDDHAHWDKFRRDIYLRGNPVSASALPSAAPSAYASPIPTAPPSEYGGSDDEDDDDEDEDGSDDDQVDRQLRRKRRLEKKRKSFKVPPNVVFMRLKERCFVNDKEGRDLSEASFDGFYYIAVELNPAPDRPQLSISKTSPFAPSYNRSGSATPVQSLLSATAPGSNGFTPRRPTFSTGLRRTDSYASVVRGRSTNPATASSLVTSGKPDDASSNQASLASQACEAGSEITPRDDAALQPIYSPSLEEFPFPPPSPSSLPTSLPFFPHTSFEDRFRARTRSSSSSLHRSVARAGFVGAAARNARNGYDSMINNGIGNISGGNRLSTNFYNAKTGYRGPWAHAVMRGFYFTPPPSRLAARSEDSTISNASVSDSAMDDDSRDTYQELELFYVGDGLGAMLEENQEEEKGDLVEDGYNEEEDWASSLKKKSSVNELEKVKKDLLRRQFYARPKASASFTLM